jgi:Family of unknown function (DUF6173)
MATIPQLAVGNRALQDAMNSWKQPELRRPIVGNIESNYASAFHNHLIAWITVFDRKLDNRHEVGVRPVSFGQTVIFHLHSIGYRNPSLIVLKGETAEGDPVELIQHVSQISILLMKLPRKDMAVPKRGIGFYVEPQSQHTTSPAEAQA